MKFNYTAYDAEGKKIKDVIEAESETAAIYHIRNQEMTPISVSPYKEKAKSIWEIEIMEPEVHDLKMKKKDLMQFADKMAIMLRAGVTLAMAMDVIISSEKNRRYQKIYRALLTDLYGGAALADSMRKFKAFPEEMVNMVSSGEATGKLDWAFTKIAELYKKQLDLSGKLSAAFTYPIFLVVLAIAMFIVMAVLVLPRFSSMYDMFGGELPGITKFMIGMSNFLRNYGLIIVLVLVLIGVGCYFLFKKKPEYGYKLSTLALKIPVFGHLTLVSNTCSFSQIAAALL